MIVGTYWYINWFLVWYRCH